MLDQREEKCISHPTVSSQNPAEVSSRKEQEIFVVSDFPHSSIHPLPQRVCFAVQVLFSGLLDTAETTWPFAETQITSNGRRCLTRTKETKMDWADLRPKKKSVFNNFYFTYNTVALSGERRNQGMRYGLHSSYKTVVAH